MTPESKQQDTELKSVSMFKQNLSKYYSLLQLFTLSIVILGIATVISGFAAWPHWGTHQRVFVHHLRCLVIFGFLLALRLHCSVDDPLWRWIKRGWGTVFSSHWGRPLCTLPTAWAAALQWAGSTTRRVYVTIAIMALTCTVWQSYVCIKAYNLYLPGIDAVVFDEAMWSTVHGKGLFMSSMQAHTHAPQELSDHLTNRMVSNFEVHTQPFLFLLLPFYALVPQMATLYLLQALIVNAGAFAAAALACARLQKFRLLRLVRRCLFALSNRL